MVSDKQIKETIEDIWEDDCDGDYLGFREGSEDDLIYNLNGTLLVYFIRAGTFGPIKIGQSDNPVRRIKDLQTSVPDTLILMGTILYSVFSEKEVHRVFEKYRIRGEWYLPSNKLINFIKKNRLIQKDIKND